MKIRLEFVILFAILGGCASKPLPKAPLFTLVEPFVPPTPDMAQIVFLSPDDAPTLADTNALYELDGDRRVLVAALAAHTGSFDQVKPGHHVFMTYGRSGHLLEANVEGGARYYVLLRSDGKSELTPLPIRMTEDSPISSRSPESGQWIVSSQMVEKTAAADIWFAAKSDRVDAAQAAALSAWQGKTTQERAALTLQIEDAVLR
jgi:hypothetical protein